MAIASCESAAMERTPPRAQFRSHWALRTGLRPRIPDAALMRCSALEGQLPCISDGREEVRPSNARGPRSRGHEAVRRGVVGPRSRVMERSSEEALQVEQGSLCPALHRPEDRRLIASFWGTSENNRKAKYYRMTAAGKRHLTHERSRWETLVQAVARVLGPAAEEEG